VKHALRQVAHPYVQKGGRAAQTRFVTAGLEVFAPATQTQKCSTKQHPQKEKKMKLKTPHEETMVKENRAR